MSECIGCGYCCRKAPCSIAARYYTHPDASYTDFVFDGQKVTVVWAKVEGDNVNCPKLEWNGQRWVCRAIEDAMGQRARIAVKRELHIGAGCSSGLNTYKLKNHVPTPEELKDEDGLLRRL